MKTLRLSFCKDSLGLQNADFHLNFQIADHPLAQRWAEALIRCLKSSLFFEKNYSLLGLPGSGREFETIAQELQRHLSTLSKLPDIATKMSEMGLKLPLPDQLGQTEMNLVHHLFEVLIGQVWAPAELYENLTAKERHSVRQLNHLVHEFEALMKSQREMDKGRLPHACLVVPLLKSKREKLLTEDSAYMGFDRKFGDVFLHYAQLGKTHLEAFVDQDQDIFAENISGLRYLTGEFDIHLGTEITEDKAKKLEQDLSDWLLKNGFDPKDPKLALGHARVACLTEGQVSPQEILAQLRSSPNLTKIEVLENGRLLAKAFYPYLRIESETWVQRHFSDSRLDRLALHTKLWLRRKGLLNRSFDTSEIR